MKSGRARGGGWPPESQRLLLGVLTGEKSTAESSWRRWAESVELDRLDSSSSRLIPLLVRRLEKMGIDLPPPSERMKGSYRHCWVSGQSRIRAVMPLLKVLDDAGIEVMVIKGAALALGYYGDHGVRRMNGFDVLVPREVAARAIELLRRQGWRARSTDPEGMIRLRHATEFLSPEGHRLDLHWHLLLERCDERADLGYWRRSVTLPSREGPFRTLHPVDQLLHTCVYGLSSTSHPPLQWIVDAWTVLQQRGDSIDWDLLLRQASETRLNVPLSEALCFLSTELGAALPEDLPMRLHRLPASRAERIEHWVRFSQQRYLGQLPLLWFSYRRMKRARPSPPVGFLRYLQLSLHLTGMRKLPFFAASALSRRLGARASPLLPEED